MGLLKRLLGSSGCSSSGRTGRGRIRATRKLGAGHHEHVESCPECRARRQRERQYLERLRNAGVPEASQDLTARLLARTEQLAAERADTGPVDTERADTGRAETGWAETDATNPEQGGARRQGRARGARESKLPALAAGGAVAALALMAGTAYFMGGDAAILVDGTEASVLAQPETAGPLATGGAGAQFGAAAAGSAGVPGEAGSGRSMRLGLGGEPDVTPAGALSADQLAAFRSQGWACPQLRELGFHLMWARAGAMSGIEVLELRLTDGRHFATVFEQHAPEQHKSGTPAGPARAGASPISVLTGHTAAADGFTPAGAPAAPEAGDGALWVNPAPPYRAIYQTASATYTYISDLPAEQADDGVAALTRVSNGTPLPAARDGIAERIERGLSRILEHLAP